ncbi:enediyne antibiotic chromoprotein [Micromonospora narathiwatensis]|uniref:Neocarzinostatin family protein n=1 Tax=Micromonospora narathiwatensis TaxID=299146 RepID=A0A1A8ZRX5_9ACTN|nr:enediyne antibiotic chromoprotein [Micromonospora narathiwatensis]SBT46868.1 Neocarzinostatin family protein [Micromonospora narathiwatensis]
MSVRNWKRTMPALGIAAVATLGLTAAASAPAAAAPKKPVAAVPTVTVTPSTGLADGQVVTVRASGLRPSTVYHIGECAIVGEDLPCNGAETIHVASTATGTLSASLPVRRVYQGTLGPEATPWGTVDCGKMPCGIGMFNDLGEGAGVGISFR